MRVGPSPESRFPKEQRKRSLRVWLVLLNLLFAAVPTYAAASDGAQVAGRIVGGCCVHMASALIESAVSAKRNRQNLRQPQRRGYPLGETLRERCLLNDIMRDCYALGVRIERSGSDVATKTRALIYYRHACLVGPDDAPCDHAERVAQELGCEGAFDCGDLDLNGTPASNQGHAPPAACAVDDLCLAPFDIAAARRAFANVEQRLPTQCENDLALTDSVRVSVVFEPTGWAVGVWVDPDLADSLIAECIEKELLTLKVPPFAGEEIEVVKTLSLEGVPLRDQLVQRSNE